jgi:hypothetical protein
MWTALLALLSTGLEIVNKSGGPEKLKSWMLDKLSELQKIRDSISGPDEPDPKR